ncbi:MAG: hypothetical protein HOP18_06770, partial [Deltaproteobacteria bacterium]|nr:hypothetical protein [Deltaproteobacteria bacterium]
MRLQWVGSRWCGALLVALLSWGSGPAWATTITILNTKDHGSGSLRQAIKKEASEGDTINFKLNLPDIIVLTSGPLIVTKSLTIAGPVEGGLEISGNNSSRVLMVPFASLRGEGWGQISNLTIRDGRTTAGAAEVPGTQYRLRRWRLARLGAGDAGATCGKPETGRESRSGDCAGRRPTTCRTTATAAQVAANSDTPLALQAATNRLATQHLFRRSDIHDAASMEASCSKTLRCREH